MLYLGGEHVPRTRWPYHPHSYPYSAVRTIIKKSRRLRSTALFMKGNMDPTYNGLSVRWAEYVRELLIELTMHCGDDIHKDQLYEINAFIESEGTNEIRL